MTWIFTINLFNLNLGFVVKNTDSPSLLKIYVYLICPVAVAQKPFLLMCVVYKGVIFGNNCCLKMKRSKRGEMMTWDFAVCAPFGVNDVFLFMSKPE